MNWYDMQAPNMYQWWNGCNLIRKDKEYQMNKPHLIYKSENKIAKEPMSAMVPIQCYHWKEISLTTVV